MYIYILIGIGLALLASVIDWQKDRSSFAQAWKSNFLKYGAMIAACVFFGYIPKSFLSVASGTLVYFFWTLIVNLFKPKPKPVSETPAKTGL